MKNWKRGLLSLAKIPVCAESANGLGMSLLLLSRVKNSVIGNGRS